MSDSAILFPVFAMVLLTFAVGIRVVMLRFKAVKVDGLNVSYFALNNGAEPSVYLIKATQQDNLFEIPVLFYAAALLLVATHRVDVGYQVLAWLFVAARYTQAYIHLGENRLKHRRLAFLVGTTVVFIIWARLFVQALIS